MTDKRMSDWTLGDMALYRKDEFENYADDIVLPI